MTKMVMKTKLMSYVNENGGWGSPQNEINISYNPLMNSNEITLSGWVYPRSKPGSFSNRPLTIFEDGLMESLMNHLGSRSHMIKTQMNCRRNLKSNFSSNS